MATVNFSRGDLRLRKHKITSGTRRGQTIFIAADSNGKINLAATQFLAIIRAEPDATRQQHFDAIAHLHIGCEIFGIEDVEYRLAYGTGLTPFELDNINTAFTYFLADLRKLAETQRHGVSILDRAVAVSKCRKLQRQSEIVRKMCVRRYLRWLMKTGDGSLTNYVVPDSKISARLKAFMDMEGCIKLPEMASGRPVSRFRGPDLAQLKHAVTTYDPSLIWKNPFIAQRNQVMLDLMYYGGLRRSEVLQLYNSDIVPRRAGGTIEIRVEDRRDDPKDLRNPTPAAKTGRGVIPVPEFVYERIEAYQKSCLEIRDHADDLGLTANLKHNFLIVAGNPAKDSYGSPLSIAGCDAAWKSFLAGINLKNLAGTVSLHALRHLSAMEYVVRRRAMGAKDDAIQDDMKAFFRWSPKSTMPAYYTSNQINADLFEVAKVDFDTRHLQIKSFFTEKSEVQ